MPIITINMKEGRTLEKKQKLVKQVTDAVCSSLELTPDHVRIILNEMGPQDYAVAGEFHWMQK